MQTLGWIAAALASWIGFVNVRENSQEEATSFLIAVFSTPMAINRTLRGPVAVVAGMLEVIFGIIGALTAVWMFLEKNENHPAQKHVFALGVFLGWLGTLKSLLDKD